MSHSNFNSVSTTLILIPSYTTKLSNLIPHVFQKVLVNSVMSDPLRTHRLQPARLLCPRNSPGKNTGEEGHCLLQGIFLTQGSNPGFLLTFLSSRRILYCLNQGKPCFSSPFQLTHPFPVLETLLFPLDHQIRCFFLKIFAIY